MGRPRPLSAPSSPRSPKPLPPPHKPLSPDRAAFKDLEPGALTLWRISRDPTRLATFGRRAFYRFNDPEEHFGVLYASTSFESSVLECWGEPGQETIDWSGPFPVVGSVTVIERLRTVSIQGAHAALIGADGRLQSGDDYAVTQQWARAIYETNTADGIWYEGRKGGPSCLALFERAETKIEVAAVGDILEATWAPQLMAVAEKYGYSIAPLTYDIDAMARVLGLAPP